MKTLSEWLAHCEQLHPQAIDMGLDRVRLVAQRMSLSLSVPILTVAGTNEKGSTCALLEAIYLQAGYKTGVYTSPHLVQFEERCRLMGESPAAEVFAEAFDFVEKAREDVTLTYFEFSTLAILKMMADAGLDVVILEVGLGGRLDAVNIMDADCAIITSIDLDHTALLGNDRETIGMEKAGGHLGGCGVITKDVTEAVAKFKAEKSVPFAVRCDNSRDAESILRDNKGLTVVTRDGDVITLLKLRSEFDNAVTLRGAVAAFRR